MKYGSNHLNIHLVTMASRSLRLAALAGLAALASASCGSTRTYPELSCPAGAALAGRGDDRRCYGLVQLSGVGGSWEQAQQTCAATGAGGRLATAGPDSIRDMERLCGASDSGPYWIGLKAVPDPGAIEGQCFVGPGSDGRCWA